VSVFIFTLYSFSITRLTWFLFT